MAASLSDRVGDVVALLVVVCLMGDGLMMVGVNAGLVPMVLVGHSSYWHPASLVTGATWEPRHT